MALRAIVFRGPKGPRFHTRENRTIERLICCDQGKKAPRFQREAKAKMPG